MEKLILSGCVIINNKKEILLLFKKNHQHYETPGGKVEKENPKEEDLLKEAEREAYEELGNNIKLDKLKYFKKIEFEIPDGRFAIGHHFITKIISGTPKVGEPEIFDHFKWIPIKDLEKHPIAPNVKLLLPELKQI